MKNRTDAYEIEKAMDEVIHTKSWRKLGKAIKLYGLCVAPENTAQFDVLVR